MNSNANNSLFSAFTSQVARLTAKGATASDIACIIKYATEKTCSFIMGVVKPEEVKSMTNQKAIKRLAQGLHFTATGDVNALDPAHALCVSTIVLSKDTVISFQNMRFTMGGLGDNDTVSIKGVSRARLHRFLGIITNHGTKVSQCSRTVGANGLLGALGITRKIDAHSFEIVNKNHPYLLAYAARLETMTDGAFKLLEDKINK